ASEPAHPGGIVALVTVVVAGLGYRWIDQGRPALWAAGAGVAIAILLLTKINVGVFAAFSAGAWWLLFHRDARIRRWAPALLLPCVAALPVGLMRPLLSTPWVQTFAAVFGMSGLTVVLATAREAPPIARWSDLGRLIIAAALVTVVVLGMILIRGT